jgi:O-antigen/teichoic acid export membrane protein
MAMQPVGVSVENTESSSLPLPSATASSSTGASLSANSTNSGIARNALFSYGTTIATALVGLVVTPLLLRHLGAAQFGLWILLLSVVGYLGLLEIGLYLTVSKRVAENLATHDAKRLGQILGTAFVLYVSLGFVALIISGVLASFVGTLFHLEPAAIPAAGWCLLLLGVNQLFLFIVRLQPAILFGAGRLDILTGIASLTGIGASLVNVFLTLRGYNIIALAVCTLVATCISALLVRRSILRHLPKISIRPGQFDRDIAMDLMKFGSRNATLSIAGTIAFGADALIIGLLLPVANVANYAIAAKLTNLIKDLCQKPIDVLLPAYSHSNAQNNIERQFQLWSESISLSMAVCLPFVIIIWGFGSQIIEAWVGQGHEASYAICAVLSLMILMQLPGHACYMILTGTERNLFLVRMYVFAAAANLLVSILLTRLLGPIGVALGSLITVSVVDFTILPWHVCQQFGFKYRTYVQQSLVPLLVPLVVSSLIVLGCRSFLAPRGAIEALVLAGSIVIISWLVWMCYGIDTTRRNSYWRTVHAAINKKIAPTTA